MSKLLHLLIHFTIISSIFIASNVSFAAKKKIKKISAHVPIRTSLVIDAKNGKILHSYNADKKIYPASLTKVMTIYMLFEALESGKLRLDQRLYVSEYATQARPCKLNLKAGERITVEKAILALVVKSANDVARVAAESIAGSERKFAILMTKKAHALGMKNTYFVNASGWHDARQITTAIDLAKLSIAIKRDFPQYYHFFAKTNFQFKGKQINGHNHVTANYPGAEGLKTGFTNPAGRNLITAATRGKKSLIGIVTGSPSSMDRDQKMVALLDQHFGVQAIKLKGKKQRSKGIMVATSRKSQK